MRKLKYLNEVTFMLPLLALMLVSLDGTNADYENNVNYTTMNKTTTEVFSEELLLWLTVFGSIGSALGVPSFILAVILACQGWFAKKKFENKDVMSARTAAMINFDSNSNLMRWGNFNFTVGLLEQSIRDILGLNPLHPIDSADRSAISNYLKSHRVDQIVNAMGQDRKCFSSDPLLKGSKNRNTLSLFIRFGETRARVIRAFDIGVRSLPRKGLRRSNGTAIPFMPNYFRDTLIHQFSLRINRNDRSSQENKWPFVFLRRLHRRIQEERGLSNQVIKEDETLSIVSYLASVGNMHELLLTADACKRPSVSINDGMFYIQRRVPEYIVESMAQRLVCVVFPQDDSPTAVLSMDSGSDTEDMQPDDRESKELLGVGWFSHKTSPNSSFEEDPDDSNNNNLADEDISAKNMESNSP